MSASSVRRTFSHGMLFTLISWVILFHPQLGRGFREKLNYGAGKENKIDSPEKYPSWSFVVRLLGIIFSALQSQGSIREETLFFMLVICYLDIAVCCFLSCKLRFFFDNEVPLFWKSHYYMTFQLNNCMEQIHTYYSQGCASEHGFLTVLGLKARLSKTVVVPPCTQP